MNVSTEAAHAMRPDIRRWIVASACVGFGQQLFVVLRNQFLHELGVALPLVGVVQGAGALMGVVVGAAGLWLLPRVPVAQALRVGVVANAAGFALQVVATRPWQFVLGAAIAGGGIQLLTMSSGPFLSRRVTDHDRVRVYGLQMMAIQTGPGLLGAVLGGELQRASASAVASMIGGYRIALAAGAGAAAVALVPLRALGEAEPSSKPSGALRMQDARRVITLLGPDAMIQFGSGLAVPFLQLYLQVERGLAPQRIGHFFGAMMLAGTVGNLAAPSITRRFGRARTLAALQAVTVLAFVGLAQAVTEAQTATALVLRFACAATATPLWTGMLHAAVDPRDTEAMASWRMCAQSIAWAAGNLAAGALLEAGQEALRWLLLIAAAVHATGAAWLLRNLAHAAARSVKPPAARDA